MSKWKFEEILGSYQAEMWATATAQWGFMPEVCEEGEGCRKEIWNNLEIKIKAEWKRAVETMILDLNSLMIQCGLEFKEAWQKASECEHGCTIECTEQKVVYTNTITRMSELERQITELEREYETEVNTFHEIRSDCPENLVGAKEVTVHHYSDTVTNE